MRDLCGVWRSRSNFPKWRHIDRSSTHLKNCSESPETPKVTTAVLFFRTLLSSYIRINLFAITKSHPLAQLPRAAPAKPNPVGHPWIFWGKILGLLATWVTKKPPGICSCCSSFKDQATATFGFKDMRPLNRAFGSIRKKMGPTQPRPSCKKRWTRGEAGLKKKKQPGNVWFFRCDTKISWFVASISSVVRLWHVINSHDVTLCDLGDHFGSD